MAGGEIKRQDVIDDDALMAPLTLAKNLETAVKSFDLIISKGKEFNSAISSATSMATVKKQTEEVTAEQRELIKVQNQIATTVAKNNEAYIQYEKELQRVKKELKEKIALGDRDAKTIDKTNASVTQLKAALDKNRVAYAALRTEEERASKEGQNLLKVIQKQDAEFKELNVSMGQFQANVGNYPSALGSAKSSLEQIAPAASGAASGFLAMTKAALAFIATPIGIVIAALGAAIYALTAYFRGSEEGQNRLNKIVAVGSAIFEQFMNVVEGVGEAIYDAVSNPKQAIIDFGNLVKENIINRFQGMLEFIPAIGKSIKLLWEGEFKKAGQVAFDAVAKVTLGVTDASKKLASMVDETIKIVEAGVAAGSKLAALQAKIDKDERKLVVERERVALEVAKLREAAVKLEGDAKRKAIEEAIALEQKLSDKEVALAKIRFQLAQLKVKTNGDDKEALDEQAEAQAKLFAAQRTAFDNTLRFQKQLEALNSKDAKAMKDKNKAAEEAIKNTILLYSKEYDAAKANLDAKISLIKQEVIEGKKTKEKGNEEIIELEKSLADDYIQIQIDKLQKVLNIEGLSADERLKVEEELNKLKLALQDAYYKQVDDKRKKDLEKNIEFLSEVQTAYTAFSNAIGNLFSSLSERRLQQIDAEQRAFDEQTENELKAAGDNDERKKEIEEAAEKRRAEFEKRRIAEQIKAAKFEKVAAIIQAGISTALAVLNQLSKGDPYTAFARAALAGVAGAIQVAAIAAKPIPQYAEGTENHPGGKAIVGEEGRELRIDPSGKLSLTPNSATLVDMPAGTQIIPHDETMKMLAMSGLSRKDSVRPSNDNKSQREILQALGSLEHTIKNKRETHYNWTKQGLEKAFQNGQSRTYFLDKFYK